MSAAIIEEAERLSEPNARKRPRPRPPCSPQPRKRRTPQEQVADERVLRARGLMTSLLPPSQSDADKEEKRSASPAGSTKKYDSQKGWDAPPANLQGAAWRQMLAMGFRPGGHLGARPSDGWVEPLPIDERRLKGAQHARAGIGATPAEEDERVVAAPLLKEEEAASRAREAEEALRRQENEFRARQSAISEERHLLAVLRAGRNAVITLDEESGREWTPLWEDGLAWVTRKQQEGLRLPSLGPDPLARNNADEGPGDKASAHEAAEERRRDGEMETYATRPLEEQLERTLGYLRDTHFFCLFCRQQYGSAEALAAGCPGLTEGEHDD